MPLNRGFDLTVDPSQPFRGATVRQNQVAIAPAGLHSWSNAWKAVSVHAKALWTGDIRVAE